MARERRDPEVTKVFRKLRNARREIIKAAERAAKVDLRPGHLAEMKRRVAEVRDEADKAIKAFGGTVDDD